MMQLIALLIEKSIEELQKRGVKDVPCECEIEQHNKAVWSVTASDWIIFLDTRGSVRAYHSLPLSAWEG